MSICSACLSGTPRSLWCRPLLKAYLTNKRPHEQRGNKLDLSRSLKFFIWRRFLETRTWTSTTDMHLAPFLFALYGRCRWSDLPRVTQRELDINSIDGRTIGYIGFTTFSHKTSSQVAKHGLPPLIAPVWGLQGPPWAIEWKKVAEAVRLDFTDWTRGPILPAPRLEPGVLAALQLQKLRNGSSKSCKQELGTLMEFLPTR